MKLLLCRWCCDVVKLDYEPRTCKCGRVWGQYRKDGAHADVCAEAEVLGINNHRLVAALAGGELNFDAWVFQRGTQSARRVHWAESEPSAARCHCNHAKRYHAYGICVATKECECKTFTGSGDDPR